MIKFFFNRFSKMVVIMEVIGFLFLVVDFFYIFSEKSFVKILLFVVVLFEYIFIRFCATKRWHKEVPRFSGIELHLKKAMVPTSYIIAIFAGLAFFGFPVFSYAVAAFVLLVIAHVNVILIYFYLRDKDKTPVNYFTGNHDYASLAPRCGGSR